MTLCKISQNRKSITQETFTVFVTKERRFRSHSRFIRRKNKDATKEVLFIIVSDRHQRHFKVVYIAAMSFNSVLLQDEMRQMIWRVKVNKASNAFEISNRALQVSLTELNLILINLFNAYVTHKYHSKQFKKAQTIVLRKLKKSNYIDLKTYWLIALLNIMNKILKLIMIKRLSDVTETHHMLSNAQMRVRCK